MNITFDQIKQKLYELDEIIDLMPTESEEWIARREQEVLKLEEEFRSKFPNKPYPRPSLEKYMEKEEHMKIMENYRELRKEDEKAFADWRKYSSDLAKYGIFLGTRENTNIDELARICREKHTQMMRELEESVPGWRVFVVADLCRHCIAPSCDSSGEEHILPSWFSKPQELVKG